MTQQTPGRPSQAASTAAESVLQGIDNAHKNASTVVISAADQIGAVLDKAVPLVRDGIEASRQTLNDGIGATQSAVQSAQEKSREWSAQALEYARNEPAKAMLMAAAGGALIMALIAVMSRSRN